MLSSDVPTSPRPLPPAKVRRTTSQTRLTSQQDWRSPPPYAPTEPAELSMSNPCLPTLLGSPISATSQIVSDQSIPQDEEWIHERSKEELEELLQRADSVIREREQEFILTSETCRTLSEDNAMLKAKNNTLIACLPASQPGSPPGSPIPTFSPRSVLLSPKLHPTRRRGHNRRVSSTPAELAVLADQNGELLNKLHDLEEEAARTDQAGKRRLKGLEREIQLLKEELDKTRAMSERLEETLQATPNRSSLPDGLDEQLVKMWKKLNREAKVRELKAKTRPWDQADDIDAPRDFAPSNSSLSFSGNKRTQKKSTPALSSETSHDASLTTDEHVEEIGSPLSSRSPSSTSTFSRSSREQALVSQLLLKIRELEETNTYLAAQHLEARIKLRQAEHETESVKKLCEFIGDEVRAGIELEMVVDDANNEAFDAGPSALEASPRKTIRLRSVSRKASLDLSSNSAGSRSSLRRFSSMDSLASNRDRQIPEEDRIDAGRPLKSAQKARKTVLGLFEEDSSLGSSSSLSSSSQVLQSSTNNLHDDYVQPLASSQSLDNLGASGSSSFADNDANDDANRMPSLGSELGLDLIGSLGLRPIVPAHTRSQSIVELLTVAESEPPASSTSASPLQLPSLHISWSPSHAEADPLTLDRQITFPAPRHAKNSNALQAPAPVPGYAPRSESNNTAQSTWSLDNSASEFFPEQRSSGSRASSLILTRDLDTRLPTQKPKPRNKYAALLVELWLWLQFIVVIVVFVCAMARMGPKSLFRAPVSAQKSKAR